MLRQIKNVKITVKNISKSYKKKIVLQNIDLEVTSGKIVGILGLNGSGKSTFLSILAGVKPCDSGTFFVDDENIFTNEKKRREIIGYVPQGVPLIEELSGYDNLSLWYDSKNLKHQLEEGFLKKLGISDFAKLQVSKMSGGMKKRLSIACAVAHNPSVLLLDEPMTALDLPCKQIISDYILDFKNRGGIVLLASHDVMELELCQEWYILKDGKLVPYQYDKDLKKLVTTL